MCQCIWCKEHKAWSPLAEQDGSETGLASGSRAKSEGVPSVQNLPGLQNDFQVYQIQFNPVIVKFFPSIFDVFWFNSNISQHFTPSPNSPNSIHYDVMRPQERLRRYFNAGEKNIKQYVGPDGKTWVSEGMAIQSCLMPQKRSDVGSPTRKHFFFFWGALCLGSKYIIINRISKYCKSEIHSDIVYLLYNHLELKILGTGQPWQHLRMPRCRAVRSEPPALVWLGSGALAFQGCSRQFSHCFSTKTNWSVAPKELSLSQHVLIYFNEGNDDV